MIALSGPIRSRAGVTYLAAALERPDEIPVLRAVARRAKLSHVALSNARASLIDAGLLDGDGRPIESFTFEALAESWTAEVVAVPVAPQPTNAEILGLHADDPTATGWALTDTLGAIVWGAHITVTADYPPDFYVPTRRDLDRALHLLGRVDDFTARAATVAVVPVPFADRFPLLDARYGVARDASAIRRARDRPRSGAWPRAACGVDASWTRRVPPLMVNADRESTVVLRSGAGDHLVRYTAALRQLSEMSIGRHAVIGGFGDGSSCGSPPGHRRPRRGDVDRGRHSRCSHCGAARARSNPESQRSRPRRRAYRSHRCERLRTRSTSCRRR